jgi:hypothetical protein
MALGSTQPLTEINTMNLPGSKEHPVHKADNLTTDHLEDVEASMSHNPIGLHSFTILAPFTRCESNIM